MALSSEDFQDWQVNKTGVSLQMPGDCPRATWKCLIFDNDVRLKAWFTLWMQVQGRLLTADNLLKWCATVDTTYNLCQAFEETRDIYLFTVNSLSISGWVNEMDERKHLHCYQLGSLPRLDNQQVQGEIQRGSVIQDDYH